MIAVMNSISYYYAIVVALLLIYRPRKDERLSWPSWLTCSGWFTHFSGHPSAAGRATMDLCVSCIGQLDFELSAMLVYTLAELRDSACLE